MYAEPAQALQPARRLGGALLEQRGQQALHVGASPARFGLCLLPCLQNATACRARLPNIVTEYVCSTVRRLDAFG